LTLERSKLQKKTGSRIWDLGMNLFKELRVWQKGIDLAVNIYQITVNFPTFEKFALVSQMQCSVASISSNIAEGRERGTTSDFIRFLHISKRSIFELETQLIISEKLKYINNEISIKLLNKITSIAMMLNKLITILRRKK